MTYRPAFQWQLGRGTPVPGASQGSRDCGPRSFQVAVDALTHGELVPSVKQVRDAMDKEGPRTTNVTDFARAIGRFHARGRRPLAYRILHSVGEVRRSIARGHPTHLCISYLVFNRLAAKTGDPAFTGGHSILICDQKTEDGEVWWLDYDSLDDHRRPELSPRGPRWVKRSVLIPAVEAFGGGAGKAWAGTFTGGQHR